MTHVCGRMPDGRPVHRLVLGGEPGLEAHVLTLGATIQRLVVAGGDGRRRDVALGYADPTSYLSGGDYRGGTIGRYANRIAGGRAPIEGRDAALATNEGVHHLHGGPDGFNRRLWDVVDEGPTRARLRLVSPDGDQGYPGTLTVYATFELAHDALRLELTATTHAPTLVNLTSHMYLNLSGGNVDGHWLWVPAAHYTPVDGAQIPLGELAVVAGTPFDMRSARRLGEVVTDEHPQVAAVDGLDHNLVVNGSGMRPVATLSDPSTGSRMILSSDQPGLQVYTGSALKPPRAAVALEPQVFPDSPHHPELPSAVLRPGEIYRSTMTWSFGSTR